jgi:hypothetical protein
MGVFLSEQSRALVPGDHHIEPVGTIAHPILPLGPGWQIKTV